MNIDQELSTGNVFLNISASGEDEVVEKILESGWVRIERIVSHGRATPEDDWYDQVRDEWVVLLKGRAGLLIEGEDDPRILKPGDYIYLPARLRHRVEWTSTDEACIWLAVHFQG